MKRLLGVLLLGLGALSMVTVSSAVPGGLSAHALGAMGSTQTAALFVGGADFVTTVHRYEVGITGSNVFDLLLADSSFTMPGFLAISPAGELFVVNNKSGQGHVSRFLNPLGATPVFNGTFATDLVSPHWATFRGDELLIADPGQAKVVRFTFDALGNAVPNGAITADLASGVRGVQVNPATGELFVTLCCGAGAHTIRRFLFDAAGNAIPNGGISHGGLSSPHGLAFSPWGELFVANHGRNSISRFVFDTAGNASPSPQGLIDEPPLSRPIGLTFSPWGELFVANRNTGTISRFIFDGSFAASLNGSFINRPGLTSRMHDLLFVRPPLEVDIKPGSDPNSINVNGNGSIPVAILTTSVADGDPTDFNATLVDALTVRFGPAEAAKTHLKLPLGHIEDVDGDGDLDLLLHFLTQETGIACGDTEATLTGETLDGVSVVGTDAIKTVGCR